MSKSGRQVVSVTYNEINYGFMKTKCMYNICDKGLKSENVQTVYWGAEKVLSPTRKETSSEACHGRARFQQHRDASCHQDPPPTGRQGAEGNSRHSDRNINLFPSRSG